MWRCGEWEKEEERNSALETYWTLYGSGTATSVYNGAYTGSECSSCPGPVQNTAVNFTGQGFLMYQSAFISIQRKQPFQPGGCCLPLRPLYGKRPWTYSVHQDLPRQRCCRMPQEQHQSNRGNMLLCLESSHVNHLCLGMVLFLNSLHCGSSGSVCIHSSNKPA